MRRVALAFLLAAVSGCGLKHDPNLRVYVTGKPVAIPAPAGSKDIRFAGGTKLCASWLLGTHFEATCFDGTAWSKTQTIAEDVDPAAKNGREPSLTRGESGALVARWFVTVDGTTRAHVRTSTDDGATWSDALLLDPSVGTGTHAFAWIDGEAPESVTVVEDPSSPADHRRAGAFFIATDATGKPQQPLEVGPSSVRSSVAATRSEGVRVIAFRDPVARVALRDIEPDRSVVRDTPLFASAEFGPGPVLCARGASVAACWIESKPGVVHASTSATNGRRFRWSLEFKSQSGAKLPLAVFDKDGTLILAWTSDKGIELARLAPATESAGSAWHLNLPNASTRWAGTIADTPWLGWSTKSGHWYAAPLGDAKPLPPETAE